MIIGSNNLLSTSFRIPYVSIGHFYSKRFLSNKSLVNRMQQTEWNGKSINVWLVTGSLSYNASIPDAIQCQTITHRLGGNKDSWKLCQERRCQSQAHPVCVPMCSHSSRDTQVRLEPVFSSSRPRSNSTHETPQTKVLQGIGDHQQGGSSHSSCQSCVRST
jgi:hypothetical protein